MERTIDENLRLIPYYPNDEALRWYQDPDVCKQVDNIDFLYTPERLKAMYDYLSSHGDCFYIEFGGRLVGDVTLAGDEISIVVCKEYQNRHIGRKCVENILELAREKGLNRVKAQIYSFNIQSRRMFRAAGFRHLEGDWHETDLSDRKSEFLLDHIHQCSDYERSLFGAEWVDFRENLSRWRNESNPEKPNNNFFVPTGAVTAEDIRAAAALQKSRGLDYLMLRTGSSLAEALVTEFGFKMETMLVMALCRDASGGWKENPDLEIRDIQTSDISRDLLDVSEVPGEYQPQALKNMQKVLEVAKEHPEYHWYCGYLDGKKVANVYALCHGGCVEMDDLWVDEAYRNRYIATTLMKHIAKNLDGILYLHADADRTPREMYARMGFEIQEQTYDYIADL